MYIIHTSAAVLHYEHAWAQKSINQQKKKKSKVIIYYLLLEENKLLLKIVLFLPLERSMVLHLNKIEFLCAKLNLEQYINVKISQ